MRWFCRRCRSLLTFLGGADDTAAAKMAIMRECGIHVVDSPAEIGDTMLRVLGGK